MKLSIKTAALLTAAFTAFTPTNADAMSALLGGAAMMGGQPGMMGGGMMGGQPGMMGGGMMGGQPGMMGGQPGMMGGQPGMPHY